MVYRHTVGARFLASGALVLILAACSAGPSHEIRTGLEPRYEDDNVRFRTTYFFRVYDYCQAPDGSSTSGPQPITDSLYRFRMTGKADSFWTKVHFESGTLKSYEIDPFGATIAFDKQNSRFFFKSRAQTERESACAERDAEVARLTRIRDSLKQSAATTQGNSDQWLKEIDNRIAQLIRSSDCAVGSAPLPEPAATGAPADEKLALAGGAFESTGEHLSALNGLFTSVWPQANVFKEVKGALEGEPSASKTVAEKLTGAGDALVKAALSLSPLMVKLDKFEKIKEYGGVKDNAAAKKAADRAWKKAGDHLRSAGSEFRLASSDPTKSGTFLSTAAQKLDEAAAKYDEFGGVLEKSGDSSVKDLAPNAKDAGAALRQAAGELRAALASLARVACAPDQVRRGFQILGPEGWRTFDQDDRLIMAMSSSAEPLTQTIKDTSARVLNEQPNVAESLLALVRARHRASEAQRKMEGRYRADGTGITKDNFTEPDNTLESILKAAKEGVAP